MLVNIKSNVLISSHFIVICTIKIASKYYHVQKLLYLLLVHYLYNRGDDISTPSNNCSPSKMHPLYCSLEIQICLFKAFQCRS